MVSEDPSISANGRYVAFESDADDVVANDVNGDYDVFVHDRKTGKTRMVSVDSNGDQDTTGGSYDAWISGTGRYIAFESNADDLVANDIDSTTDVFVRDRKTGKTRKVSVRTGSGIAAAGPSQDACISANGRYIAFASDDELIVPNDDNNSTDVFVRDTKAGKTRRVSVTSGEAEALGGTSRDPFISATGRLVTFESSANDLVALDDNGVSDIFVRDRKTGKTKRVSVSSSGDETDFGDSTNPGISGNGRWVIFESGAENLVSDDDNGATTTSLCTTEKPKRRNG